MRKVGGFFCALITAALALQLLESGALAADTMADWVGENTNTGNATFQTVTTNNNYGLISSTSVGGTVQSKVNFHSPADPVVQAKIVDEGFTIDYPFIYFADQTLEGPTLDFRSSLHMEGTITFNSPTETEPNFCFCWFNSVNTAHRIGLGISNLTDAQNLPAGDGVGAVANKLRIDFGYAAGGGNKFYNVSADGTGTQSTTNSVMPNGTYPFVFDYTPGPIDAVPGVPELGGMMDVTVGDFFRVVQPLETNVEDSDFFPLDRFGIVQRTTGSVTQNPTNTYSVIFSNVTYTGGTAAAPISGDHNGDGTVDAADYVDWRKDPAANGGDPDGYNAFVAQFGPSAGSGGGVPEPGSLFLILCGSAVVNIVGLHSRRR